MRNFHSLIPALSATGFNWLSFSRREFEVALPDIQQMLDQLFKLEVLELHLTDLLNNQLPSHYDYTSEYDVIIFRRLARGRSESDVSHPGQVLHAASASSGPPILRRIDTSPIGFLVIDKLIITVHPADCAVRDAFALKLLNAVSSSNVSHSANRLPANPTDEPLCRIG